MIKTEIQKIVDNSNKFKLLAPKTVLVRTRYVFLFEEENDNKIILILSNITNKVELLVENPNDKTFEKFNFDLSQKENNLLCFTFEKILCKKRLEYRKNSNEDLEQTKRNKGIDKNTLERNKSLQKKAIEFLSKINFNKQKKKDDKQQNGIKK